MSTQIQQKWYQKMDWSGPIQVAIVAGIILGANLPFFFLHRSEMKEWKKEHESTMKEMKSEHASTIKEMKSEHASTIKEMKKESDEFWRKWAEETKEFHGRLSKLEEKTENFMAKK